MKWLALVHVLGDEDLKACFTAAEISPPMRGLRQLATELHQELWAVASNPSVPQVQRDMATGGMTALAAIFEQADEYAQACKGL